MHADSLRNSFKTAAKKALYKSGYYQARARLAGPREKRLVILMYHDLARSDRLPPGGVIDEDKPTPSQFEAHLRELTSRYRVVPMEAAVGEIRGGAPPDDSVAVTFDDGSESVYTVAFPLLVKYGVPATVFVVPEWIEKNRFSWWQLLCELVEKSSLPREAAAPIARILGPAAPPLPAGSREPDLANRRAFVAALEPLFRGMPDEERTETLRAMRDALFPGGGFVPLASRVLDWAQIEEMAAAGVDIQSHTQTHIHIAGADLDRVDRELHDSKRVIERRLGKTVTGFAYPFGKDLPFYRAVEPLLRGHGYTYACNACRGSNGSSSNIYSLYRCTLPLTASSALINRDLHVMFRTPPPNGFPPGPVHRDSSTLVRS